MWDKYPAGNTCMGYEQTCVVLPEKDESLQDQYLPSNPMYEAIG